MTRSTMFAAMIGCAAFVAAQTSADRITSRVDWTSGTLTVTIERPVPAEGANRPAAIADTQAAIRRDSANLIAPILQGIRLDSARTVGDHLLERETAFQTLLAAADSARVIESRSSSDLRTAQVTFSVDLRADLGGRFVTHERTARITPLVRFAAEEEFTGILIYAADPLPVYGTPRVERLLPALFPALHYIGADGLLYRLAGPEAVLPSVVASSGSIGYTTSVTASGFEERIGPRPLRILARGAYGIAPTDIVLGLRDATRILSSESNRRLIREGRVVVVVSSAGH